MTIRVLLVDDQPQLRVLVRRFFSLEERSIEVVAEASSAAEALAVSPAAAAHVAVVDARLPDRSGLELAADLRAAHPGLRIVLFTGHVDVQVQREAEDAGVDAVVSKESVADLAATITGILDGAR